MTTTNQPIKGFKDYEGKEAEKRAVIREMIRQTFERYGFSPVETPIIESEEFVKGDNSEDEAVSDIYKLQDKGKRNLALRYEFTFQLKRIAKNKKLPYKRYQSGPVFRDEPVSKNRFRQFTQCDADIIGSSLKDEAELLFLVSEITKALGIDMTMNINNRKLLNEILDKEGIKNKEQVLREIDKLDKFSEKYVRENLEVYEAEKILKIIKQPEEFFKKYEAYEEIEKLKEYCKLYGIKINFLPSLVRGLSYYNGTVFETQGIAGGSYRIEGIQSTGISFGLERISALSKLVVNLDKYLIVSLEQDGAAISLAQKMRKKNKIVSMYYGKPSKALEYANSYGFQNVIFVGAKEVKQKKFKVKIMKTGREVILKI